MSLWTTVAFWSAYAVVGLLTVNVLFCTRWMWWVKLGALAMSTALCVLTWQSLPPLYGWPATSGLPERFNLVGIQVIEPDKSGTHQGDIFLWATAMNLGAAPRIPRAFVLPFDPELQLKVVTAGTKLRKSLPQLGEIVATKPGAAGHAPPGARKAVNLEFFDLPDPLFPEK